MRKLKLLIGLGLVAMLSSCSSEPYEVTREIEIGTPVSEVYARITTHTGRAEWSPWDKIDPEMKVEVTGPENGVGAKQSWSSENEDVGTGSIEIIETKENEYVKSQLTFVEPFQSESIIEWWLEENDGVTKVKWGNKGELPAIASLFMDQTMDEMLGSDFEKGLASLKALCEENYTRVTDLPQDSTSN